MLSLYHYFIISGCTSCWFQSCDLQNLNHTPWLRFRAEHYHACNWWADAQPGVSICPSLPDYGCTGKNKLKFNFTFLTIFIVLLAQAIIYIFKLNPWSFFCGWFEVYIYIYTWFTPTAPLPLNIVKALFASHRFDRSLAASLLIKPWPCPWSLPLERHLGTWVIRELLEQTFVRLSVVELNHLFGVEASYCFA